MGTLHGLEQRFLHLQKNLLARTFVILHSCDRVVFALLSLWTHDVVLMMICTRVAGYKLPIMLRVMGAGCEKG